MRKKLIITVFSGLLLLSCSEDYLDVAPTEFTTPEQVGQVAVYDPTILNGFLAGIYTTMINAEVGGTTGDDDFGQKGIDIYTDMLSGDLALTRSAYGWYRNLTRLTATEDFTRNENYVPWRYYYRIIFAANTVIKAQGGNAAMPSTAGGRHALGQAKAMRAYAHFYLQQLYAKGYVPTDKSIPLKLDPDNNSLPRSTSQEVMNQVVKDFEESIVLLDDFVRSNKGAVNNYVAKGLLAYAYGYIGDVTSLNKAKALAKDVADNSGANILSKAEAVGGFNDVNTSSWLWGADLTADNGFGLTSWWGQMDVFTYSYQWAGDRKAIDNGLFALINANDVRKTQFNTSVAPTASRYLLPYNKFYDPGRVEGGQETITTDLVFMRVEEMYLLYAECAAKTGDESSAKTYLKQVLSNRFNSAADFAYVDALTGQALTAEIYLQTKIEFWGEGKSYLAMKRNRATITRGTNHLSFQGQSFPYDDGRLTFDIPQSEVINNPNL